MNRKLTIVLRSLLGLIFIAGPAAAMFHALLAPAGAGPAALVIGLEIFLAWQYRRAFEPLFVLRADFGRPHDLGSVKKQAA